MDLLQHLRNERAEKRRKQSLAPTLFDRINGLVKKHALDETFLKRLDVFAEHLLEENPTFDSVKPKPAYEPPLFSLAIEDDYRVTMAIINRVANPYLNFVSSPDEILLCEPLFRQNPALPPERLACVHFEGLLLAEVAKKQIQGLSEEVDRLLERQGTVTVDSSQLSLLQARIESLHRFLADLEGDGRG